MNKPLMGRLFGISYFGPSDRNTISSVDDKVQYEIKLGVSNLQHTKEMAMSLLMLLAEGKAVIQGVMNVGK